MEQPKISIVTVSFNSAQTIERTIESVISQSYPNKEYIIIDGASKDGTQDIVKRYGDRIDLFISEKDNGISDAFNKGISHSTGEYIVFINSDDFLLPDSLTKVAGLIDGKADIYCCNLLLWNEQSGHKCRILPSLSFPTMPFFKRPVHQGVFARKSLYEELGGYDTRIRYAMDLDFLMRATKRQAVFRHLDIDVAVFKLGGATSDSIFRKKDEYKYIVRKNGGNALQAALFYYFLVATQVTKNIFKATGFDLIRKVRYKKVK